MKIGYIDIPAETTTVKVSDVVNAIEKNGYTHLREVWFQDQGACVLGQGALNLGVVGDSGDLLMNFIDDQAINNLYIKAAVVEKITGLTLQAQLNRFKVFPDSRWFERFHSRCGSAIIFWNDHRALNSYNRQYTDENGYPVYTLPTYADVVAMVKEVLAPYMEERLELLETSDLLRNE